jgi:hypothetical protein
MNITVKNTDLLTLAKLGVWLDDPYGDGIRLTRIRIPSPGRMAALELIRGTPVLGGTELILAEYLERVFTQCFTKQGKLRGDIKRNFTYLKH